MNAQIIRSNGHRYPSVRVPYRADGPISPPSRYWPILWQHRLGFAGSVLVCLLLAAFYSFSMSPLYRAEGTIELQPPPSQSFDGRDGQGGVAMEGPTFDSYLETQIGILDSDTLIRRVITRLNLTEQMNGYRPKGLAAFRDKYLSWPGARGPMTNEEVFRAAKNNLTVRQSRLNNLIEVLYDGHDPKVAAAFVNALIDEYQQQNLEARWQTSQSAGNWFARHLTDLRKQLEAAETELQNYSRANGLLLVNDTDQGSVAKERLSQLQEALSKAQSDRMTKQAEMEMVSGSNPDSVPQVLDNEALREYQVKISDLQRELADDRQIYTAKNPKVKQIQAQIASLQAAWGRQRASVLARADNEYKAASRNEKMLEAAYAAQARIVTDQNEKMIRYETLKHEVDTDRQTYESLLQKVKEVSVNVALQATNVRVVDAALPPPTPYKPSHLINLSAGLLAGLIAGFTLVTIRHRSDRRVRHPGSLQHYLTTRELGVIPSGGKGVSIRALGMKAGLRSIESNELKIWLDDPNSLLSTSFRSVMTSIVFATRNPSRARFVVVTSPGPGEGKTTVASNLAAAFAATGRRVLLVDADLRRPRLRKVFDLPETPGLREFAAAVQAAGDSAEIDRFVQATAVPDLFVMPSGKSQTGTASLLYTLRFEEVFSALRKNFDTVLIDAPPLLCVPEARVMARLADGVVLVARAGATSVDALMSAETYVREDGGTVIGTVLNDAAQRSTPYYSSGYLTPLATA